MIKNAFFSFSIWVGKNVEEIKDTMVQDEVLNGASSNSTSSSSHGPYICLLARDSKVSYVGTLSIL
jgi:hypothetical protein